MPRLNGFAASFMGVDRSRKAAPDAKNSRGPGGPNSAWFLDCYSHSNFSFLGVYLTHKALEQPKKNAPGELTPRYTNTSTHVGNEWTHSWEALRQQGWGCNFIYAGHTTLGSESKNNIRPEDFAQPGRPQFYGTLHAQHIKVAIAEFATTYKSDNDGSVVFLDNEGGELAEDTNLLSYYAALFEELRRPGPDQCQPVRPGVYAWGTNSSELVNAHPDLFVWWLDSRMGVAGVTVRKNNDGYYPIPKEAPDFLYLEPEKFDISAASFTTAGQNEVVLIPVGIQGLLNYCRDPWYKIKYDAWVKAGSPENQKPKFNNFPNLPLHAVTTEFLPMTPWDLDMSFVRDPRYPHGSPRIGVDSSSATIARGIYVKIEKRMMVSLLDSSGAQEIGGTQIQVEPEAPLILPNAESVITIEKTGKIILSSRSGSGWSAFTLITPDIPKPALRRARTLAAIVQPDASLHVLYVARDQTVHATSRSTPSSPWTALTAVGTTQVHGFSNLAITTTAGQRRSISAFYISSSGLLSTTTYTPAASSNSAPVITTTLIEPKPPAPGNGAPLPANLGSLFLGTALAAINPNPTTTLIFGIHKQSLLLTVFSFDASTNQWTGPKQIGQPDHHKLFAHTRLAVSMPVPSNPLHVQVAAISYTGVPWLFNIAGISSSTPGQPRTWDFLNVPDAGIPPIEIYPRVMSRQSQTAPRLPPGAEFAPAWSVNPYGDICFGLDPTFDANAAGKGAKPDRVIMMAGTGPDGATGILYRRIGRQSEDWFRVTAWSAAEGPPGRVLH